MPPGLLAELLAGRAPRSRTQTAGRAGVVQKSSRRGRPFGTRPGALTAGKLNLVETLRVAAPWQPIRRAAQPPAAARRVLVTPDDFRINRLKQRSETATIFVVDASGSAALNRLAEAKGAVEIVLADCYVRRDQVALIAFRGQSAEILLPPTSSLVRAKRSLAALPGGGGTPLAAGLAAGLELALSLRRAGKTPVLILLSDGRANIARDGKSGRPAAEADALAVAKAIGEAGFASVCVDTSPRPAPQGKTLASAMGGRYLPLPYADASVLGRAITAATNG
jgi:magnesium chelatase subunit D